MACKTRTASKTAAVSKTRTEKKGATKGTTADEPMVTGSQADYERFEAAARALPASDVLPMRADLRLALHNVKVGVAWLEAERERAERLDGVKVQELLELPHLVLATIFADTQVQRAEAAGDVQALLRRAVELRSLLLKVALGLVEAQLLPPGPVEAIQQGSGAPDLARDCVALAALFTKHASSLRGKHPLKASQVEEASRVGTDLLNALKSGRARRQPAEPAAGVDMRDRLWTLVVKRHELLWRVGAFLFGPAEVDVKVPALQAKRGVGSRKKKAASGEPAAPEE